MLFYYNALFAFRVFLNTDTNPSLHFTAWNITFISMIRHFLCCPRLFLHNTCRTSDGSAGLEHGRVYANVGGVTSDPDCYCYVLICLSFSGLFYSQDLHKKEETMVFEAHCMSFPCGTLIIQLCQDKDSFPLYSTFNFSRCCL